MDFWGTFWPTFLANVSALLIFAIPWALLNRRTRRQLKYIIRSISRSRRGWVLKTRFFRLVLKGRRRWQEYDNWIWSERVRQFYSRVICDAPAARLYRRRTIVSDKLIKEAEENTEWLLSPESAFAQLVEASGKLTFGESGNTPSDSSFQSMAPREKAQFLTNKSPNLLLLWALQLGMEDRRVWYKWLNSEECLIQLEAVFSESAEQ